MPEYRNVQIEREGSYLIFKVGSETYGADTLSEARSLIDEVMAESFEYRGVCCLPECDNDLGFTVAGHKYRIWQGTPRPQLEAAIRAIIDGALGAVKQPSRIERPRAARRSRVA